MNTAQATHLTLLPDPPEHPTHARAGSSEWHTASPELQQKIAELQARTICYNRELMRIAREMNELRSAASVAR